MTDELFELYAEKLHQKYQGHMVNWSEVDKQHLYSTPFYTDDSNVNADGQKVMLYDNDHLGIIQKQLAPFERKPLEVSPDGDWMYHSILTQVHYDKNLYNAEMLRKQAVFCVKKT